MRLVLDTNVFISAALKQASWPGIIVRWLDRNGVLLKSEATEAELMEVIHRPKFGSRISTDFIRNVERLFDVAESVTILQSVTECRDPKDDKFLELALNGRADLIVSGDADLLSMRQFRNIPIIEPAVFGRSQIP